MSIATTIAALKVRLALVDPATVDPATTQSKLARIYSDPAEAVNMGDFPLVVMYAAPQTQHMISEISVGSALDRYTVRMLLLLGSRTTGLEELHARVMPWPRAFATVLFADLKLSGAVEFIGSGDERGELFTWNYGPKAWGEGEYFGIAFDLPVTEWFQTPMA